ncbi:hypothetical protein GCM10007100_37520 [Roseibacillus persicicus]|uniref:Glycosyl transferase family 1 domain-containing protein n=2 Tax=Roseibacillus persicicus TaxID=454148 RepID=A0A918WR17_9BACT|nr:hypothetical protein GCM10007100_37520 [Roseibacillus persicicus]
MIAKAARTATFVLTPSDYARKELINKFGTTDKQTLTVRNGLDHELFYPDLGQKEKGLMLAVGRQVPEKGIGRALEVFEKLSVQGLARKLVVVGEGPERDSLLSLAQSLAIVEKVEFIDCVTQSELAELYRKSEVLLNTSNSENYSNALVEAMACGCLVAGFDVGGNGEIIQNFELGVLVKPFEVEEMAEGLALKLSERSTLREIFEKNSQFSMSRHQWNSRAERLEEIFDSARRMF